MGKSSKKSATKVEAAPAAVVPVSKSGKKGGKREAENEIVKAVSAKQKRDALFCYFSEAGDWLVPAPKTKTVVPPKKPAVAAKKEESSSSESSSDSDEDEVSDTSNFLMQSHVCSLCNIPAAKTVVANNGKKAESSESSESSEDESEEDEAPKVKAPTKLPQVVAKNGKKKDDSSSSDTESSEDSEDDDETPAKVTAPAKKVAVPAAKKPDSSGSEDSDSDDEPKNAKPATKASQPAESESKSESDSDEDEDDKPQAKKIPAKAATKESSSDEDEDEESLEEESEEDVKTAKKKDSDVEMVDAQSKSEIKAAMILFSCFITCILVYLYRRIFCFDPSNITLQPKTHATPGTSGSKTLFAGNLSFRIEQNDVVLFFKNVGQVVDVRFARNAEGTFRGFGHVKFATAEEAQKALEELNGSDLCGCLVRLDLAHEKGERGAYTPHSGKEGDSYQKGGQGQSQTIFVRGFDTTQGEDEIRSALQSHFGSCGEITRVSILKDYETGAPKGMAYMDFSDADALNKAFELDGSDLGNGYCLNVQPAKPKGHFTCGRDRFDSGGRRGVRRGGRFDSGGRHGGRYDSGGRCGGSDSGGRRGGRGPSLATPGTGQYH
uniref:nucleolin 1-like isoform X2 n=1 Tax=Fragaria vesca subsp. vesca TaxID=101020 RepID=UPI0005C83953|nr:PREDICTED: nucleolin 1-like isoform X2 [Fragaria vesca subsp. vesca]